MKKPFFEHLSTVYPFKSIRVLLLDGNNIIYRIPDKTLL